MDAFDLEALLDAQAAGGRAYLEFLRRDEMSAGLYVLPVDASDPQQPHREDELYVIMSGRARIRVGENDQAVGPGSVVYVPRGVAHYFHTITEELQTLVIFAPPENG